MKSTVLSLAILFSASFVFAQEDEVVQKDNYPYWSISKEVQKIQFKAIQFRPVRIVTGTNYMAVGKGVQQYNISRQRPVQRQRWQMTGTPSNVISKGVARMQYERNANK